MSSIGINTSQNVQLRQSLASLGQRIAACIIDWALLIVYYLLAAYLSFDILAISESTALTIALFIPLVLYTPVMEYFANGQTIGKRSLKIRVISTDGTAPGIGAYLLRWLLGVVDFLISSGGIAVLLIIFTEKGQRLGDLAAGTTVVREAKSLNTLAENQKILSQVDENYEPVFTDALKLSERDYRLMQRSLKAFREDGSRAPIELLQKKLEAKMQLPPTGMHPIKFLETLQKDYQHYAQKQAVAEGHRL
jgi:uncharacterized RDD family membrane protein YckC